MEKEIERVASEMLKDPGLQKTFDRIARLADAQVVLFRKLAAEKGWEITPEIEERMVAESRNNPPKRLVRSTAEGVKYLQRLYQKVREGK